jgi:tetratricopeptide (TPR) repeat protein
LPRNAILLFSGKRFLMEIESQERDARTPIEDRLPDPSKRPAAGDDSIPSVLSMSRGPREGSDILPIVVLMAAVLAILVLLFFGVRGIRWDGMQKPVRAVSQLIETITGERRSDQRILSPRTKKEREFQKHMKMAHKLHRKKKYEDALKHYNQAIRINPKEDSAFYWRGQMLIVKGDYGKGIRDLEKSLKMNPGNKEALASIGWAHSKLGQWDDAIRALTGYITYKPDNGWAYYQRGHCYYKAGDRDSALKDAKRSCDLGYKAGCSVYEKFKQ